MICFHLILFLLCKCFLKKTGLEIANNDPAHGRPLYSLTGKSPLARDHKSCDNGYVRKSSSRQ